MRASPLALAERAGHELAAERDDAGADVDDDERRRARCAARRTRCCRRSGSSPAPAPGSSRARPRRSPPSLRPPSWPTRDRGDLHALRRRPRGRGRASACGGRRGSRRSDRRCARARGGTARAPWRPAARAISIASSGQRVAPVRLGGVLLGRELGVVDDEVRAFAQAHHAVAHRAQLGRVLGLQRIAGLGRLADELLLDEDVAERRGVGHVADRARRRSRGDRRSRSTDG